MSQVSEIFEGLLDNLRVNNGETIASRRDEITKVLNKEFRNLAGSTDNRLMVGSYGRWTAIRGISDLDLLYFLPSSIRTNHEKKGGPTKVLTRTRSAIQARYPNTSVTVDRLVVVVQFSGFMFEVQPVFENSDGSFSYPDTYADAWKTTKPRDEIDSMSAEDSVSNGNLRKLCKMARAWKNRHGIAMGGLLIDTLSYNFMNENKHYRNASYDDYDGLVQDFFLYLSEEEDHEFYAALGSRQRVRVKKRFQRKAKKAYELCVAAISAEGQRNAYKKWRSVFGNSVPVVGAVEESLQASAAFRNTEEFIEDEAPVDIRYSLTIDCTVTQDGFRPQSLREILGKLRLLPIRKQLTFKIVSTDVPEPYEVRWKVLNRGEEAERRDKIRGQIEPSTRGRERRESTDFRGAHVVECYLLRYGTVVARDSIEVPISPEASRLADQLI